VSCPDLPASIVPCWLSLLQLQLCLAVMNVLQVAAHRFMCIFKDVRGYVLFHCAGLIVYFSETVFALCTLGKMLIVSCA
jgi:hypothetical protein